MNDLPRVAAREWNPQPVDRKSSALTTTLSHHIEMRDDAAVTSGEASATGNAQSPSVERLVAGTTSVMESASRKRHRRTASTTLPVGTTHPAVTVQHSAGTASYEWNPLRNLKLYTVVQYFGVRRSARLPAAAFAARPNVTAEKVSCQLGQEATCISHSTLLTTNA